MKNVRYLGSFKKDYKHILRRHYEIKKLDDIILHLRLDEPLSITNRPHLLLGDWRGYWECHVIPDWLLIYKNNENELVLARTGTHSDIFG